MTMSEHPKADRDAPWSDAARQSEEGQSEFVSESPNANNPPEPPGGSGSPDEAMRDAGADTAGADEPGPNMSAGLFTGGSGSSR